MKGLLPENFQWNGDRNLLPHWNRILEGEYDVLVEFEQPPIVLDIGANVGVYALWASERWPGCEIHSYEPEFKNFSRLRLNQLNDRHFIYEQAIFPTSEKTLRIYRGRANDGCHSVDPQLVGQNSDFFDVSVLHPKCLPNAEVFKIDAEGVELEVISIYLRSHPSPKVVSFEWHREKDRKSLSAILASYGYELHNEVPLAVSQIKTIATMNWILK